MVENFRVTLTLLLAVHVTILGYLALTSTSSQCKDPAIAYLKIENSVFTGTPELNDINLYSQTKPLCIGVLGTARADNVFSSGLSSAVDAQVDSENEKFKRLSHLAVKSKYHLSGGFGIESSGAAGWNCEEVLGYKTCLPDDGDGDGGGAQFTSLEECESSTSCKATETPMTLFSQASSSGYEVCGDLFKTVSRYLASECKQGGGSGCDITDIMENLPDMCSRLELAGILLGAGLGASYLTLCVVLFFSQDDGNPGRAGFVLFLFVSSLALYTTSFVLYNLELYGDQVSTYFWTPIVKRLDGNFKAPLDSAVNPLDSIEIVMGSSYYYLAVCIFMNLAGCFAVLLATIQNNPLYANISKKVDANVNNVQQAVGSLLF